MNRTLALALPLEAPERPAPPLRGVEVLPTRQQRHARPRAVYAVTTMVGVLAILAAQLIVSIVLSEGAYEISALQSQQKQLDRQTETLTERMDLLSSPQQLAISAQALGMQTASAPAFLRLADAAVLGAPASAGTHSVTAVSADGGPLVANSLLEGVAPAGLGAVTENPADAAQPGTWIVPADAAQPGVAPAALTGASVSSSPGSLPTPTTR